MHNRLTYMYINFQQNRVSRSLKSVHTNLFEKNCKLHKFATTNSNFAKLIISDMNHRITYMYVNFQHNRVGRQIKTVHTKLLQNNVSCINLQLATRILKNHAFRTCTTP